MYRAIDIKNDAWQMHVIALFLTFPLFLSEFIKSVLVFRKILTKKLLDADSFPHEFRFFHRLKLNNFNANDARSNQLNLAWNASNFRYYGNISAFTRNATFRPNKVKASDSTETNTSLSLSLYQMLQLIFPISNENIVTSQLFYSINWSIVACH